MVVNTNMMALNAHRSMKNTTFGQQKASTRLSSGLRINSAADDAAGLAISEKMRSQIRGLDMASRNTQDGISFVQTAEGGLEEITNMVQRIRELTVQAANDVNTVEDREKLQGEVTQLLKEIDSMSKRVEFNKKVLLDGTQTKVQFQVGANASQLMTIAIANMDAATLGINSMSAVANKWSSGAKGASFITKLLTGIDTALETVAKQRAALGAVQNRMEHTMKSLDISSENLTASESRIRDTDMAKEMMNLTKFNVLSQAATSVLAQANQNSQNVLQILR